MILFLTLLMAQGDEGMDIALLKQARDAALKGGGSGIVMRGSKRVISWGDLTKRYDLKSTTKSFGATALGIAIKDGKLQLSDPARDHHPAFGLPPKSNKETGWLGEITISHLATQTAGFDKRGGYTRLLFKPGTRWAYSDGGPNWLAECITLAYRMDLQELMFKRVFTPLGIGRDDLTWRRNAYRDRQIDGIPRREFGSGISANVDALARIGLLYLRGGRWNGKQILDSGFVDQVRSVPPEVKGLPVVKAGSFSNASDHYGLLWWNNADGALPDVPRDAYWSWGLHDSWIIVIPSLDVVASRAGKSLPRPKDGHHYDAIRPFITPIAQSVRNSIEWAPASSIVRRARGGDNWPSTWGDDGALYTAYGDGNGFKPRVPEKLSLGFAKVIGGPDDFKGVNVRSSTGERKGGGASGAKASGLLMVDGTLFAWVRNAVKGKESRLAWSVDRAKSWTWAKWTFSQFGYLTFVQYGRNYAGARDDYIYCVSHDNPSAYQPADRFVLLRVHKDKLRDRDSYEFFVSSGRWSRDFNDREAIFINPGRCRRSGISYNAGLKQYLWWQLHHVNGLDTRFKGGFGVYSAPDPWGPWTRIYFTEQWDVGPGETAHFPPKWMSADGRTVHLIFSGDDSFSVRRATINHR